MVGHIQWKHLTDHPIPKSFSVNMWKIVKQKQISVLWNTECSRSFFLGMNQSSELSPAQSSITLAFR